MKLRQALILAINTSILAVLFVFMSWLYWSSRADVERSAEASMERAVKTTEVLAGLRERELSALARSLAASPMLRGALATSDRETIADVLASASAKNGLSSVQVIQGGKPLYGAGAGAWTAFIGEAEIDAGRILRLTQPPVPELLDSWTGITEAFYALGSAKDGFAAKNLPAAEQAYYEKRAILLDG
ncbi:MAG: hypothetical protein Q7J64_05710, partial [Elusimicrobiota bacterium]|nr:hypothetical protein [Elusimicrobiota bacterium]